MDASINRVTPKSSLIGMFPNKPSISGYPIVGNLHILKIKHLRVHHAKSLTPEHISLEGENRKTVAFV